MKHLFILLIALTGLIAQASATTFVITGVQPTATTDMPTDQPGHSPRFTGDSQASADVNVRVAIAFAEQAVQKQTPVIVVTFPVAKQADDFERLLALVYDFDMETIKTREGDEHRINVLNITPSGRR